VEWVHKDVVLSLEHNHEVEQEMAQQIQESREHAEQFKAVLALAEKRFAALTKIEKRHADEYKSKLETLQ